MLTSLQNPLVKQIRKLRQAKERRSQRQFLIEGTHLLEAACAASYPIEVVCYTLQWQGRYPQLWQQAIAQARCSELVSPEVLKAVATTVNPDGVVATASRRAINSCPAKPSLGLVLETIQDPGNLGAIIRTAAAADVDGLWLSQDSVDLDHPKVLRSTAGQWFKLPMQISPDLSEQIEQWRQRGVQVLATAAEATRDYWSCDLRPPTVLLLGNEGSGLTPELSILATDVVKIPISPAVESLNVAIAAAIILFEAQRQRQS
ncbi:MAG: RNA methyltransferase [Leptolyngbyaceae cyanobacterium SM1_1_3]|nr:RNA methyltransferase [Leptolyngbyaceae cyanobacterium SM1_1_3]NJN01179.1 RNA methyltransferase [Leptolyngbyaceae cyanobacterium RM1_1_2]NJO09242.1 RNA methyltransferase [Leptolyngbyaceae cyanobacterium SL_1_1]